MSSICDGAVVGSGATRVLAALPFFGTTFRFHFGTAFATALIFHTTIWLRTARWLRQKFLHVWCLSLFLRMVHVTEFQLVGHNFGGLELRVNGQLKRKFFSKIAMLLHEG